MAAPTAAVVWGDYNIPGDPSSGNKQPKKSEARAWGAWLESFITGIGTTSAGSIYTTRALLFADLVHDQNDAAWVIQDATVGYNGIYRKNGATGTGSWTRVADLPYSFIEASNTGAGTANAVQATTTIPVVESALVLLNFTIANTGAMTVSFNGGTALDIKSNSGSDIAPGGVVANMLVIGRQIGSTFRIVTDQVSSAIVAAAEAAQAAAESAASALMFSVYPDVATAQGATINSTASYIAIASFSPQPRFYKRFATNPGSGDRFQSADGAWWQGVPLPGTTIDYVNAVQHSSNASLVSGDLDLAHRWTIPVGTTYTVTLPDPSLYVGRVLDIGVNDSSRGKLAVAYTTNPIGKFAAGGLFLWAGENMTLIARATEWEIIGGRCIPCMLYATAPGPDVGMASGAVVNVNGWQTALGGTIQAGAEHAINGSGQIVIPRQGFYTLDFDVAFAWSVAPTVLFASANGSNTLNRFFSRLQGINEVLHAKQANAFSAGTVLSPCASQSDGGSIAIRSTTYGPPQFKLIESPQW
ncbi:UNVERIFIED_ORG: hypothetical protein GGI57_004078 [Rhizobium aethiopicum]